MKDIGDINILRIPRTSRLLKVVFKSLLKHSTDIGMTCLKRLLRGDRTIKIVHGWSSTINRQVPEVQTKWVKLQQNGEYSYIWLQKILQWLIGNFHDGMKTKSNWLWFWLLKKSQNCKGDQSIVTPGGTSENRIRLLEGNLHYIYTSPLSYRMSQQSGIGMQKGATT